MLPRLGSIRTQVQILAALSAATAVAVACGAFVLNDARMLSRNERQTLYRYAALVARNAGPPMCRDEWDNAQTQLSALRLVPTVTAACLYDATGTVVATYLRDESLRPEFPPADTEAWLRDWGDNELALFQPVYRDGLRVGSLFFRSTRDDLHRQQAIHPPLLGLVFVISLGVSAAFASRIESRISGPTEVLSRAAERVTAEGDYSVRVRQNPGGQLGDLCAAFNAMLAKIETADRSLRDARDKLNTRVRERTRELHREVLERRYAESIASGQTRVLQQLATGRPLADVLTTLIAEIESHVRHTHAAISRIEPGEDWFGEPIGVGLSRRQREGLRQLPISPLGSAPARAAATLEDQVDQHRGERPEDPSGFEPTEHGGACWAAPVTAADGRLLAVITLFHRHDRRPNPEELELVRSAGSLASLAIEQRHGEDALEAAVQEATAANRAKSEFLANVSHEIRTPLNAVLGFADLLLSGSDDLDAERREYLQTIASSGKHLLTLINDILDLSKIEASRLAVEPGPADPNHVLDEVMSPLRVRAVEKGIALECEWRTPAPEVVITDAARLRQLLRNLVGNAIKFTDHGGVRVTASIEDSSDGEPRLRVDVTDTGIGIPEEKLAEVFNPFVQGDASVTRRRGGTGIGLAISRRLAEAMGGELTVTSTLGEGSCFTLRLPTGPLEGVPTKRQPVCDGLHSRQPERVAAAPERLDGFRVLVVEDGETNRRLIGLVLRRAGVDVAMAHNGRQGVEAAMACGFDAILMDTQMPIMDGYTATRELRDADYGGPIIALTAHATKGDQRRCLEAGFSGCLAKPIETHALLAELDEIRREPPAAEEVLGAPVPAAPAGPPALTPPVRRR